MLSDMIFAFGLLYLWGAWFYQGEENMAVYLATGVILCVTSMYLDHKDRQWVRSINVIH